MNKAKVIACEGETTQSGRATHERVRVTVFLKVMKRMEQPVLPQHRAQVLDRALAQVSSPAWASRPALE